MKSSNKNLLIILLFLFLVAFFLKKEIFFKTKKGSQNKGGEKIMRLVGKKILMIIAPEDFRDEELLIPKNILEEEGPEVLVASKNVKTARGMLGKEVKVDKDIKDINIIDYDAIIFVGGTGAAVYFFDQEVFSLIKETVKHNKIIGAICIAPSILANAGIMKGKKSTAYPSEENNLIKNGANFIKKNVVIDGKIITANGPESAEEFGWAIRDLLLSK